MGLARKKSFIGLTSSVGMPDAVRRLFRRLPQVKGVRGFRIVSYSLVVAAVVLPALVWNSLSVPVDDWREPALPFHGPIVLVVGILVLEVALILWVKMLQFGNERVRRHRQSQATDADPAHEFDVVHGPAPAGEPPTSSGPKKGARVLVVDDDPINRMILRKQLLKLNVEPVSAADGMEALDAIQQGHWDMILMDGQMPRLDGPETALEIRLRELLPPETPIVGITTNDTPEFRERCLKAGMQACYHKPVRRFVIEKLVDVYIRQRMAEEPDHIIERALTDPSSRAS